MSKLFLIFSHELTKEQIKEAKERYNINEFIQLDSALQNLWSKVPVNTDMDYEYIKPITDFVKDKMNEGDYAIVQGEYGTTYMMVNWCFQNGIIPIYSTTKRQYTYKKQQDGTLKNIHIFKHVAFREYKDINEKW